MKTGDPAPRPPKNLRTEEEIIASWKGDADQPMVSIRCATFNHVDYICDAIHGFLSQKTDFPFNVVIHDDASTDGTADIVREYEGRYPRIIKGVYQERNLLSQGIRRDQYMRPFLKGKYIAVCEGDDYWMDPNKLQIQVRFLEDNPEYVISGHDAFILDDGARVVSASKLPDSQKRDFDEEDLIHGRAWILTLSWVYRNIDIPAVQESRYILNGDIFFTSRIGWHGKSKYHAEIRSGGYRRHVGGIWSMYAREDRRAAQISSDLWIARYYRRIGKPDVASSFDRRVKLSAIDSTDTGLLTKELLLRLLRYRKIMAMIRKGRLS
jgi:glycosyltransferase involved in cell wall biosynthesis